jgi:hypothetical protein
VAVGGTGVSVGGAAVFVGGKGVAVSGGGVGVAPAARQPVKTRSISIAVMVSGSLSE